MSTPYNDARNQVILVNVLLLVCIFLGVDAIQEAAIKFGFAAVMLKNLSAIPCILICVLIYTVYRLTIEWLNSESEFKKKIWNKLDYRITLIGTQVICFTFYTQEIYERTLLMREFWVNSAWSGGLVLGLFIISFPLLNFLQKTVPHDTNLRTEMWTFTRVLCVHIVLGEIYLNVISQKVAPADFFAIFFLSPLVFLGIPIAILVPQLERDEESKEFTIS
ncbi:hypothetical protein H6F88_14225 [Oculatella sp. FACHB-28]|uniref:hypothetical protein n=1 Tax=Oculatella sp. FACHB-28 TaxID=2692845 RepID=UPI0016858F86|nr:hypothetical protein [Oculatella sp. FACHB-28]MBD2057160.1 hypothetical protein [Oculatella sp. FACHB-28]